MLDLEGFYFWLCVLGVATLLEGLVCVYYEVRCRLKKREKKREAIREAEQESEW